MKKRAKNKIIVALNYWFEPI